MLATVCKADFGPSAVAKSGAIPLLMKVAREDDGNSKYTAAETLCMIICSEQAAAEISTVVVAGIVPLLLQLLLKDGSTGEVAQLVRMALSALANNPWRKQHHGALLKGGVQALVDCLRITDLCAADHWCAVEALHANLKCSETLLTSEMFEAGLVSAFVQLLQHLLSVASSEQEEISEVMLYTIVDALDHISLDDCVQSTEENVNELVAAGAIPLMLQLLRKTSDESPAEHSEMKERAAGILSNISRVDLHRDAAVAALTGIVTNADECRLAKLFAAQELAMIW